jgi:hypothetical protein
MTARVFNEWRTYTFWSGGLDGQRTAHMHSETYREGNREREW